MLFAVATPTHMMAPVSAGTLRVVPVTSSIQAMPASAAGKRGDDDERVRPGLEVDDDQQIHQHDRADEADRKPGVRLQHGLDLAAQQDSRAARQLAVTFLICARMFCATEPRSRSCTAP